MAQKTLVFQPKRIPDERVDFKYNLEEERIKKKQSRRLENKICRALPQQN